MCEHCRSRPANASAQSLRTFAVRTSLICVWKILVHRRTARSRNQAYISPVRMHGIIHNFLYVSYTYVCFSPYSICPKYLIPYIYIKNLNVIFGTCLLPNSSWMMDKQCRPRSDAASAASDLDYKICSRLSVPVLRVNTLVILVRNTARITQFA